MAGRRRVLIARAELGDFNLGTEKDYRVPDDAASSWA
jgi:hypothetical protein